MLSLFHHLNCGGSGAFESYVFHRHATLRCGISVQLQDLSGMLPEGDKRRTAAKN